MVMRQYIIPLLGIICSLLPFGSKEQTLSTPMGVPEYPIKHITLTSIEQYPAIIVRAQDYEMLRRNFEQLPDNSNAKRNKIVRAWFSDNENDREAATREFIRYWKNYTKRWSRENIEREKPDGVSMRGIWRCIHLYDLVESYGYLTEKDRLEFRDALVRTVEYALGSDPDNLKLPGQELYGWRVSNIWADVALSAGTVALAFPELPQAEKWLNFSVKEILWILENGTWDGAWHECPRYHLYQMKTTSNFFIALFNRTGINLFTHPAMKSLAKWCIDFSTPRDLVAGAAANVSKGVVMSLGLGDSTWGENMSVINICAYYLKDSEPQLSKELMWLWKRTGFKFSEELVTDLLINPSLPATGVHLKSTVAAQKGHILMRDRHDTKDEVWFLLKCGKASLCGHENGDANSFSLMAFGAPLALDAGSGDYGDPNHKKWNKRSIAHNLVIFRKTGETDPEKYNSSAWENGKIINWQSNDEIDYSVTDASIPNKVEKYIRHVVFMKPQYFVIMDEIKSNRESSFLIHSPAERIEWDKHSVTLYTPWKTWLDVHAVLPERELQPNEREGQIGAWTSKIADTRSWYKFKTQKYIEIKGKASENYVTVLHPRKKGIKPLKTSYDSSNKELQIEIDGRKDIIRFTMNGINIKKGSHTFEYANN